MNTDNRSYTEFFNGDYKTFALYDNIINLPDFHDGFKVSQRKVIFSAIKKNCKIKVDQLKSYTAEQTNYKHGEDALNGVITNLARNYPGYNNYNYLYPYGQFGNTLIPVPSAGRYIYTEINSIFSKIFKEDDIDIVQYQFEEGDQIEPKFYIPLIPALLINPSSGIGNGFSFNIIPRSLIDVIKYITNKLKELPTNKIRCKYRGFTGKIEEIIDGKVTLHPVYTVNRSRIHITDLPSKYTLEKINAKLDVAYDKKMIKDYTNNSKGNSFNIIIKLFPDTDGDKLMEKLKLHQIETDNLTMWRNNEIVNYETIYEYVDEFIDTRLALYTDRLAHQIKATINKLNREKELLRFLTYVIENVATFIKLDDKQIDKLLDELSISDKTIINMPLNRITKSKIEALNKSIVSLEAKIIELQNTNINDLYLAELKELAKHADI